MLCVTRALLLMRIVLIYRLKCQIFPDCWNWSHAGGNGLSVFRTSAHQKCILYGRHYGHCCCNSEMRIVNAERLTKTVTLVQVHRWWWLVVDSITKIKKMPEPTGVYGSPKGSGQLDSDRSKSAAAAARNVCRTLAETTSCHGIKDLHRARGKSALTLRWPLATQKDTSSAACARKTFIWFV